jgi:hypothetical protein
MEVKESANGVSGARSSRTVHSPIIKRGVEEATRLNVPEHRRGVWVQAYFRLSFAISQWIQLLDPRLSFETTFVSLTNEELEALLAVGRALLKKVSPTDQDLATLSQLEERVQINMLPLMQEDNRQVFLKLDSRSPKDVVWEVEAIGAPLIEAALAARGLLRSNDCVRAQEGLQVMFSTLHNTGLAVTSGHDAIQRLVNSFRCLEDLGALHELKQYAFPLDNAICLRKFDTRVASGKWPEFRAFVHANQLTAISQYDRRFNVKLHHAQAEIQELLETFFAQYVQRALETFATYIIDFAIVEREKNIDVLPEIGPLGVKVVELNSFESWTGACLFSWSADQEVLLHGLDGGASKVAFRIASQGNEEQEDEGAEEGKVPTDAAVARALAGVPVWAKALLISPEYLQRLENSQESRQSRRCIVS